MKTTHPRSWFTDRIGKQIARVHPERKDPIEITDEQHAGYLYEVQCEAGYRYSDVKIF